MITESNVMIAMRDGVRLATDVYRPEDYGPIPVLVARTPYDKNNLSGRVLRFVESAYAVVVSPVAHGEMLKNKEIAAMAKKIQCTHSAAGHSLLPAARNVAPAEDGQ